MIKFLAGLFIGSAFGFLVGAVLSADKRDGGQTLEPGEMIIPKKDLEQMLRRHFDGFEPAPDFDPFCPPVCGNCKHWDSELFAWGECKICRKTGVMRAAGDVCNVREHPPVLDEEVTNNDG